MNRNQHRQETAALNRRFENKYFPKVKAAIQSKVDDVISIVKQRGAQAAKTYLDHHIENYHVTEIVKTMALDVGLRHARRQWRSLQDQRRAARKPKSLEIEVGEHILKSFAPIETKGFGFNEQWVAWIKDYLFDFIVRKITFSVFETTKDVLFTVLNKAIDGGWGIDQTVKALSDLPLPASQAARIVRTEITRAANAGVMAAGSTFPFQQTKEWISAHDPRTRDTEHASHVLLDGQVVDYEDVFRDPINGIELIAPGDPKAGAAETVNCRCSAPLVAKVDENGRLIPKRQTTTVIYPSARRRTIITI